MQDYKKLHSSFELLEIELKKINAQNETLDKSIQTLSKEIKSEISEIKKRQDESLRKNKFWFGAITGLLGAIIILTIVGFII